jgi:TNF receptor-associated protein 1
LPVRPVWRSYSTETKTEAESLADPEETPAQEVARSILPPSKEQVTGDAVKHDFQTETQKILSIVAQSLYTDREVFVRELISNASDALEKVRHLQVTGKEITDKEDELEIDIYADEATNTLVIQDAGVGMSKEELIQNLGRIGHSGSLEFLKKLGESPDRSSIIGQFGVGFYSAFMVANKVKVYSRSAIPGSKGYLWESDGSGTYTIAEAEGVSRGTKIIIELKESATQFSDKKTLESIIKKYSNFVGFPINVNMDRVNTVRALWLSPRESITEDEHKEFYQFIARAYDTPMYRLHYSTDAPLNIRGLFYFPSQHMEKYGMGRLEPGVSLFSRKVLITAKAKNLLPDWLRFVKGVVDSEDIPLNISREHMQDSSLIQKLNSVLTKRILKFLEDESKVDPEAYTKWYAEFGNFLKEGLCTDFKWKAEIGRCLRFESSDTEAGKITSLEEYVSRMKEGQREIYYLCIPGRQFAESSPYYEGFKAKGWEVLFLYATIDDFVMTNLGEFNGKKIVSIESTRVELDTDADKDAALSEQQVDELCSWMRDTLSKRVTIVRETKRLHKSPAIITDHETASYRRMMRYTDSSKMPELPKQQLEINASHPLIKALYHQKTSHPVMATEVAEQILDNAMASAGLLDDSRSMIGRIHRLLEAALQSPSDLAPPKESPTPKNKPLDYE